MDGLKNHLKFPNTRASHLGKVLNTSINSISFENYITGLDSLEFKHVRIPPGYEHRADLISNVFFGTPTFDWLICWYNNIKDPFQQLNAGDMIKIPRLAQ